MRRSNAPSISAKRTKFQVPLKKNDISSSSADSGNKLEICSEGRLAFQSMCERGITCSGDGVMEKTSCDLPRYLASGVEDEQQKKHFPPKSSKFISPSLQKDQLVQKNEKKSDNISMQNGMETEDDFKKAGTFAPVRKKSSFSAKFSSPVNTEFQKNTKMSDEPKDEVYYSVMWGKISTKKHKKWEGDGILIVCGKQITLKDMEAKQIAKGNGYKAVEVSDMCDGSTLRIGGKEIEVTGKILREDYLSGKCFLEENIIEQNPKLLPNIAPKPFIPHKKTDGFFKMESNITYSPRYDPTKEGALVMPKPSKLSEKNFEKSQIIDVVVDPFISYHLRPHQREGVIFLYESVMGLRGIQGNGAILADEMGLGKTLQCISLIWTLLKQSPYPGPPTVKKALIITPGSLVKNWCQEFTKWLGSERVIPYGVNKENRVDEFLLQNKSPVMVISYEMFLRSIDDIRKGKFNIVVCDEAHRLKNANIKTGNALSSLGIGRRILLTGTPIQNNLEEFHTLADIAIPGVIGSLPVFKKVFVEPITTSQQPDCPFEDKELGKKRAAELSQLMSMFCLRRTSEINKAYLPPKVEHAVFVKMSCLQSKIYSSLLSSAFIRRCLSSSYGGTSHLVCIDLMKKLCNDPMLIYKLCLEKNRNADSISADELKALFPDDFLTQDPLLYSAKLQVLDKMLQFFLSRKEKCVIVSNSTKMLNILQGFCNLNCYTNLRLDGQTPTIDRQAIVNRFNDKSSDTFIFLLSSKAGGVGLNLTGASQLILYDIDWNPANDLQSMARVWRDGQKREVHIYRFIITGSVEEKMFQRQISKQTLSEAIVDAGEIGEKGKIEFSKDDLKDLFTWNKTETCTTHDLLKCTCIHGNSEKKDPCDYSLTEHKNSSMAELMQWEHIHNVSNHDDLPGNLRSCEQITFIFRTR